MKGRHKKRQRLILLASVIFSVTIWYLQRGPASQTSPELGPAGATRSAPAPERPPVSVPPPVESGRDALRERVDGVDVKDFGKPVFSGTVDLSRSIARIRAGERHSHHNDGAVFQNRERRLPRKPRGYYREYVHPTEGVRGPGPQRLIVGEGDEWYYTPDHYKSFIRLDAEGG